MSTIEKIRPAEAIQPVIAKPLSPPMPAKKLARSKRDLIILASILITELAWIICLAYAVWRWVVS